MKAGEAPKTWKDILSPAYKDGISAKLSTSGMQHAQWYTLRKLYGNDLQVRKAEATGRRLARQLFDRLAKGDDRAVHSRSTRATPVKEKGADRFVAPPTGCRDPRLSGRNKAPHPEAGRLFVDWALSKRGQIVYQTQPLLLYGSLRTDAPPMGTGKRLADFKLLFPTDWNDYQASHALFVKEWNGIMGL